MFQDAGADLHIRRPGDAGVHLPIRERSRRAPPSWVGRLREEAPALAVALVFTLASAFGLNAYRFATADNSITIAYARALLDPALYPGDFLIAQMPFYYTFLWRAVTVVVQFTGVSLPSVVFGAFLVALFATFYAMHRLSRTLFGSNEAAALALFFLVLSRSTMGGVETIPHILTTRGVATPILLFALDAMLRRRVAPAFALAGLAYLVHPLTTHYVLAMLLVGGIVGRRHVPLRRLAGGFLVFLGVASPLLIWKFTRTPASLHLFSADPRWLEALGLRSFHHMFPFREGIGPYVDAARMALILGMGWHYRRQLATERNRMMAGFIGAVVALCVLGYVFSEIVPIGGCLIAQPMRSFVFLEYFACLYIAHYLIRAVAQAPGPASALFAVAVSWGILFAGPRETRAAILYAGVVTLVVGCRLIREWRPIRRVFTMALASGILVVGCASFLVHAHREDRYAFSFDVAQPEAWRDAQRWASGHTDRRDAFIVPPELQGSFRVESGRTIYADWVDGGLMNGNPAYGVEWLRRMRALGLRDTSTFVRDAAALPAGALVRVAEDMRMPGRHVFLVVEGGRPELHFRERYRNEAFTIYEVPVSPRHG